MFFCFCFFFRSLSLEHSPRVDRASRIMSDIEQFKTMKLFLHFRRLQIPNETEEAEETEETEETEEIENHDSVAGTDYLNGEPKIISFLA